MRQGNEYATRKRQEVYVKDALVFRMIIKTPGTAHQINPKPSPSAPTILTAARTEPPRRNNWPIVLYGAFNATMTSCSLSARWLRLRPIPAKQVRSLFGEKPSSGCLQRALI